MFGSKWFQKIRCCGKPKIWELVISTKNRDYAFQELKEVSENVQFNFDFDGHTYTLYITDLTEKS